MSTAKASTTSRRPLGRNARGTAMVEFVLTVPLLAIILGLTFFFGWAFMHKHQVVVASRYAAWQGVETGRWPSEEELNEKCFANKAISVSISAMGLPRTTAGELKDEVGSHNRRAEAYASELLLNRFPGGRYGHVSADFSRRWALWEQYRGAIHDTHGREGITWRRDEVECWSTLRDQYLSELDELLRGVPDSSPGKPMAETVRRLYLVRW